MPKTDLGIKRVCRACGMRFYDFNRKPALCPGCGAEFDPENIVKSRKGRPPGKSNTNSAEIENNENPIDDGTDDDVLIEAIENEDDGDSDIDFDEEDVDVADDDDTSIIQDDIGDQDELLPSLDDKDDS